MVNRLAWVLRAAVVGLTALNGCALFPRRAHVRVSAITPASVRLGDSVAVRVVVENLSGVPVWLEGNHCSGVFRAYGDAGDEAGSPFPKNSLCPAYSIQVLMQPHTRHETMGYWLGRTLDPRGDRISVAPGRYRIEPMVGIRDRASGRRVVIRRVNSTITVTP